ncbi:L-threonylcarbamoyladenylate synthase [Allopontixanthobacter sp.]|uniref:L-threonylcarbamoyladenylate synthase n=1 Tax=Allopontixanthobacter sp. TaxID=2906452 RepID=UPI002ABB8962|nr:L-threonylcarbamoyladenylate synthase [Allopontixanthobacter sp.]MDZ4308465.1 L-threonylcarbamoyladenylate synthase [Allopontixanthobacter sp.]
MTGKNATEMLQADRAGIARAARILQSGGLVAVPTETVYGLAARADDASAVAGIYAAKGRPGFNPLIVHVDTLEQAEALAEFSPQARRIAQAVWPGPVTLVLPRRDGAPLAAGVSAGLPTIALRMPAHPVMRALIRESGCVLAAPSANPSNAVSPTTAAHVAASLGGRIDAILDGGACEAGLESTILAIRHDASLEVLRPGPFDLRRLSEFGPVGANIAAGIEAPGQLRSHYSPGKPVRLAAGMPEADEFMIGFGGIAGDVTLSAGGDLTEAAANLYAALHSGGASSQPRIAVAPIPETGVGAAINDRLRRASASR